MSVLALSRISSHKLSNALHIICFVVNHLIPSLLVNAVVNMSDEVEYRCFIGGLSWSTDDRALKDAFSKFGRLLDAKVN